MELKRKYFRSAEERAMGLQGRRSIPGDTLFVFPGIRPGELFHAQNVPGAFDLAFLGLDGRILSVVRMAPPFDVAEAPMGATDAVEAAPGLLERCHLTRNIQVR